MKLRKLLAPILICSFLIACNKTAAVNEVDLSLYGNTNGNITNWASVCEKDSKLYFQNTDDEFSIYSSDIDGNNTQKLNSAPSYFINVFNDYIFYVNENDDFKLYRMNLDGSDDKKLIDNKCYNVTVYNDYIYYSNYDDNQRLYKASIDGSTNVKLIDTLAFYPIVGDDKLFYVDGTKDYKIYQADLDGNNIEEVQTNVEVSGAYLNYANNAIYYTNPKTDTNESGNEFLYKTDLNNGNTTTVIEAMCADINIYNNTIYYNNLNDKKIYSCDLLGKNKKELSAEGGVFINVTSKNLYYIIMDENSNPVLKKIEL